LGVVESTCRHIDILRFDTKPASTALARALFGSFEERGANALAARIRRHAKIPEKRTRRTIAKQRRLNLRSSLLAKFDCIGEKPGASDPTPDPSPP